MLLTHAIVLSAWLRFSVARNEFEVEYPFENLTILVW